MTIYVTDIRGSAFGSGVPAPGRGIGSGRDLPGLNGSQTGLFPDHKIQDDTS